MSVLIVSLSAVLKFVEDDTFGIVGQNSSMDIATEKHLKHLLRVDNEVSIDGNIENDDIVKKLFKTTDEVVNDNDNNDII